MDRAEEWRGAASNPSGDMVGCRWLPPCRPRQIASRSGLALDRFRLANIKEGGQSCNSRAKRRGNAQNGEIAASGATRPMN
jgi:hypothetical protein